VKDAVTGMVEVDPADGCFPLPNGPGLGVTLNEAFVAEHPPKDAFFDLFAENWHQRRGAAVQTSGAEEENE
jgi:galactonate dehydratase